MEEKIENIFNNEYSKNTLTDFLIKTQKVYEFFGYEFRLNPKEIISKNLYSSTIWLNKEYTNLPISNIEIVTFDLVYPKLITRIVETNLERFNEIYSKLIESYKTDKNIQLKKYINMVYGCIQNPECVIYSKNIHLIPNILNKLLNDMLLEFKEYIIYIHTDEIFFRNFDEIRERFEKYFNNINKYELTYFSEKSKFGLFMAKTRYIIEENGNIKIKGMKHFNKDGVCRGGFIRMK